MLPAFAPVDLPLVGGSGAGPMVNFVVHQVSITGSFLGSRAEMQGMLAFAQTHGIAPRVELMPVSEVNEAMLRVEENRARYRVVLVND